MHLDADRRPPSRHASRRLARVLLASTLLGACATGPEHFAPPRRGSLRLDTESVARLRHASVIGTPGTATATLTTASTLARVAPLLLTVLRSDEKANELDQRLKDCARQAERQVNF